MTDCSSPSHDSSRRWSALWRSTTLTGTRVASAIAVNKVIAVHLGPEGLALVGQFQNFTAVAFGMSSGNVSSAVIATVSAARDEAALRHAVSTAVAVTSLATGAVALCIALAAHPLARHVFADPSLAPTLQFFAVLMVPLVLNLVVLGTCAGRNRPAPYTWVNASIAVASVPACWLLIVILGLPGAMLSAVAVNASGLLLSLAWVWRQHLLPMEWLWGGIERAALRRLLRAIAMTSATVLAVPASQLVVRQLVVEDFGAAMAGRWQAVLKVGEVLMMTVTVAVSLHFLPRFSAGVWSRGEAVRAATLVVAGTACLGAVAIAGADWFLPLLFSKDFGSAAGLLPMQLAGDSLRGGILVLQAAMMSQLRAAAYAAVDVAYAAVLAGTGLLLVPDYGANGAATAVLAASVVAAVVALTLVRGRELEA